MPASKDAFLAVGTCALITHFIFNRFEPTNLSVVIPLLVLLPIFLSGLLVQQYGFLLAVPLSFAIYHTTLFASIGLYRISPFHPLARYPGPFLAKLSRWYWTFVALKGRQHLALQRLHEQYGDIVRIGPNEVSIRDVSAIQPMMGAQGLPKGPMWIGRTFHPPILPLIGHQDTAEHARRRRPWNRAFSSTALKEYQPVVHKRGAQLVEILAQKKRTDFVHWVHLFTFDFMSDALFGGGSNMLVDEDKDGVMSAMKKGFEDGQLFEHEPWLGVYAKYVQSIATTTLRFRAMCFKRGMQRYEKGSEVKDLFYYLSNEDGAEKESPPKAVVLADSGLAMIAGSDTTASVLGSIVYCLIRYPDVYKRLQAEVDKFYPPEADSLDPVHHANMPYLEAVINETMRLYPVVPSGSQRAPAEGSGGNIVGPYFIPEGTQCRMHFWSVHRDPRNFSHPETFYPDRWLIAEGLQPSAEPLTHNANAFMPFSFGPWNCVGKNLALLEMKMVLCHLVQKLEMRFQDGWDPAEWERRMEDRFVVKTGPLPLVVAPRV